MCKIAWAKGCKIAYGDKDIFLNARNTCPEGEKAMLTHDITVEQGKTNSMETTEKGESQLLFNYYRAPVAIAGESIYDEITITKSSNGAFYFNVYTGNRTKGTTTLHVVYRASPAVLDAVLDVVRKYNMKEWNNRSGISLDGMIQVVKFQQDNEKLIRVSSDNMPENGQSAFVEIHSILHKYLKDAERIK